MRAKLFVLLLGSLAPAAISLAGDGVPLDKDFSFRLEKPAPGASSAVPFPAAPSKPEDDLRVPLETPEGQPLPPGSRAHEFNGQTYYLIPLLMQAQAPGR